MNFAEILQEGPQDLGTILLFAAPIIVAILLLLFLAIGSDDQKRYQRRVTQIKKGRQAKPQNPQRINAKRSTAESQIAVVDRLIKNALPKREELRNRLDRAGLKLSLAQYLGICFAIAVVAIALNLIFKAMPPAAAVLLGLTSGIALPHMTVGFLGRRRRNKFLENFPEAIDLMVRGLKSGLPITESIRAAGEEVPDPVGVELRQVTDAVALGRKLEDVLWEMSERLDIQEFKFFTVSLSIQAETGGNLSETLQNLSNVLRGRRQLKLKIKAMSSEAKASAYIIGCLPFVVGFFIYLVNPGYITKLFIDPRGHFMIGAGGFMFLIGGSIMYKMVKFEI